jgi:hypothetical protein
VSAFAVKAPKKKAKLQHGIKNKSAKKTTISDSRLCRTLKIYLLSVIVFILMLIL